MKKNYLVLLFFLSLITLALVPQVTAQDQSISEFIAQLQESLERNDIPSYLDSFSAELRDSERAAITRLFEVFDMERVSFLQAHGGKKIRNRAWVYIKVIFHSSYSVVIETWHLFLVKIDDKWQIKQKNESGSVQTLYKIEVPSERIERVETIEIEHSDIKIVFEDALVFYDNIPNLETALIVMGKGRFSYSPSLEREKHHLKKIFKREYIEDSLEYVYLRFSDSFFKKNIKIVKKGQELNQVSQIERNNAYSLFVKHYSRSFTLENSLVGDLLSLLPQGDEVVFGFEGKKIGNYSYIYSPFSREEINFFHWKSNRLINVYSPPSENGLKKFYIAFAQMFRVKRYQIDIDFNPESLYFSGRAKIFIQSNVGMLDGLNFKFNPALEVLRIRDAEQNDLFYSNDKFRRILYVYFLDPPSKGEETSIEIYYRGKIEPYEPSSDVINFVQFYQPVETHSYKQKTFLYSRSSLWYPAPSFSEYFTAQLKITVPPEYACISNGILTEEPDTKGIEKEGNNEELDCCTYVFDVTKPVKYLSFIVGKFTKEMEEANPLPFLYYASSEIRIKRFDLFKEAQRIHRFYERKFGAYPFEKFAVIQRPWFSSGGHSSASFIVLNSRPSSPDVNQLVNEKSPVDFSRWKEYFLAHEMAHQWWGHGVTWSSYHDQWISEGLAQFSALLYLTQKYGEKAGSQILKKMYQWTMRKTDWGAISMGSRINYLDYKAYQSIVYNKTAMVLNMLKDLVGEELFFKNLKEFFNTYKYSAVRSGVFFRIFQENSELDLEAFFEQWFESYSLPNIKISREVEKKGDTYLLKLKVTQLGDTFMFPLWIEWSEDKNKGAKMVVVHKQSEDFVFELKNKPKKIKVNPDQAVPGKF
ncbi:M1 family metallopeptidase [Acidobacteriota bacterium]